MVSFDLSEIRNFCNPFPNPVECKSAVLSYFNPETTRAFLKIENNVQKFYDKCIEQFASTITYHAGEKTYSSVCNQFKSPQMLTNIDESEIDETNLLDFFVAVGDCQMKVSQCFSHVFANLNSNGEQQDTLAKFMDIKVDSKKPEHVEL